MTHTLAGVMIWSRFSAVWSVLGASAVSGVGLGSGLSSKFRIWLMSDSGPTSECVSESDVLEDVWRVTSWVVRWSSVTMEYIGGR